MTSPLETAWKIHDAQMDWTGKVDAKAGFALALDTAAIATIVALSDDGMIFANVRDSWAQVPYWLSIAFFVAAGVFALLAVVPALRHKQVDDEAPDNFIYFGHLKHWQPTDLALALTEREPLPVVSRQLVHMAGIAWDKHIKVGWSLWLAAVGLMAMLIAALGTTTA